jgi:predicted O-linked N-acetylglucosamine transferase (SPINDLY family)
MKTPPRSPEELLREAAGHGDAGRVAEAEALYREVLVMQPEHAHALHLLGLLVGQRGDWAQAIDLLLRATVAAPNVAEHYSVLGEMCRRMGRLDQSVAACTRAIELSPALAEAHNHLANALRQLGREEEAVVSYNRALEIRPDYADAYSNLGNALRSLRRFDAALAAHRQAVRLKPHSATLYNNLGLALIDAAKSDEAIAVLSQAIRLRPDYGEAHNNLGNAWRAKGHNSEAIAAYRRALQLLPDSAEAYTNMGGALRSQGRLDESLACQIKAIQLNPRYAEAYGGLGGALADQGRLDEAIDAFRTAIDLEPGVGSRYSPLLYTLHFHPGYDARQILTEHGEWSRRFADPLTAGNRPLGNEPSPNRRLRVGYVSPDFRRHPVGRFMLPLLKHHDHGRFEIFCYSGVRRPDDLTDRLRRGTDHWRETAGLFDDALAQQVRQDRIDVLVDLTMHMTDSRLLVFARRAAPVQVSWLAYVGTTGLDAIDYRLSDPFLDPPGPGHDDGKYAEETYRLPLCYWCYEPTDPTPDVSPLPALQTGYVTFGCFNNFCKVTTPTLQTWARLLQAVPRSRLVLHGNPGVYQQAVRGKFAEDGIDPERLEFVGFRPVTDYLRQYHRVDLALDPFPYGGGTTTCDGLWMGVPAVTLAGQTAVGRSGVSLLTNLGLPQLIAATTDEYVSIATEIAEDLPSMARLRAGLRARMQGSPLMDAARFAADMEAAFRDMWGRWCAKVTM